MNQQGFLLRESRGIPYYTCCALDSVPHLRHGFSTRRGELQSPDKNSFNLGNLPENLAEQMNENRRRFLNALRLGDAPLLALRQVHSNRVHIIEDISRHGNLSEGDALATRLENVALSVQVADCLPVLIVDPFRSAIAAVHSGWRGTLSGILPQTVQEMERAFCSDPSTLLVAIGPGIRTCCFEVGQEVADLFEASYPGCCSGMILPGKYHLDLGQILDAQMNLAGVKPEHRHDMAACTRCNPDDFFSYRREGQAAGRMMAVIAFSPGCP